jgi:hypothetical protein
VRAVVYLEALRALCNLRKVSPAVFVENAGDVNVVRLAVDQTGERNDGSAAGSIGSEGRAGTNNVVA